MEPKEKANRLDKESRCVVCEKVDKKRSRGLCKKHYEQYRRHRDSLKTQFSKDAWEQAAIDAGKLLESRQGRRMDVEENAFADLFAKFAEQMPGAVNVTSPEELQEAEATAQQDAADTCLLYTSPSPRD